MFGLELGLALLLIPRNGMLIAEHLSYLQFDHMQSDRVASLVGGYEMWANHIFFGAGLGAFVESQLPVPLVIHNTGLWILAEMGLFGLLLALFFPVKLITHSLRNGVKHIEWEDAALILVLLAFGGFSIFHEISYQRMFWFVLGMLTVKSRVFSIMKSKISRALK